MKVLYLGVYKDGTGWSQATIDNILALDSVNVDVVPRAVKLNARSVKLPDRIAELEKKSSRGANVVIQHLLPHMMEYNGGFSKNIAIYYTETSNFRMSNWPEKLNMMSEAWLANNQMLKAARASYVDIPMYIVYPPTDTNKYQRSYSKLTALIPYRNDFIFYTIGEMNRRRNFAAIIRAFHSEFDPAEPVQLLIKTHQTGISTEKVQEGLAKFCDDIKIGLKLYKNVNDYKPELLVTEELDSEAIGLLHNNCDCFVSASYGEAWSIPAFEAMAHGKTPIVPAWGGFAEYISDHVGWLVRCKEEAVFGVNDNFQDLYTGVEEWASVSIPHMRRCMREAFENRKLREAKAEEGQARAYEFSYEKIGQKMKGILENHEQEESTSGERQTTLAN
jgi:glycosyltransferase involved in cell wall biosynthesis